MASWDVVWRTGAEDPGGQCESVNGTDVEWADDTVRECWGGELIDSVHPLFPDAP